MAKGERGGGNQGAARMASLGQAAASRFAPAPARPAPDTGMEPPRRRPCRQLRHLLRSLQPLPVSQQL